jgi:cytochrome c
MIRSSGAVLALILASPAVAPAAEDSEFGVLVDEPGVEETYYTCTACHSEMIIAQQGLTRERWDELLDWMVEDQGMPELDPGQRETILDYLAEHYNTGRPNFPR